MGDIRKLTQLLINLSENEKAALLKILEDEYGLTVPLCRVEKEKKNTLKQEKNYETIMRKTVKPVNKKFKPFIGYHRKN